MEPHIFSLLMTEQQQRADILEAQHAVASDMKDQGHALELLVLRSMHQQELSSVHRCLERATATGIRATMERGINDSAQASALAKLQENHRQEVAGVKAELLAAQALKVEVQQKVEFLEVIAKEVQDNQRVVSSEGSVSSLSSPVHYAAATTTTVLQPPSNGIGAQYLAQGGAQQQISQTFPKHTQQPSGSLPPAQAAARRLVHPGQTMPATTGPLGSLFPVHQPLPIPLAPGADLGMAQPTAVAPPTTMQNLGNTGGKSDQLCRHYSQGKCTWSDGCRFRHDHIKRPAHVPPQSSLSFSSSDSMHLLKQQQSASTSTIASQLLPSFSPDLSLPVMPPVMGGPMHPAVAQGLPMPLSVSGPFAPPPAAPNMVGAFPPHAVPIQQQQQQQPVPIQQQQQPVPIQQQKQPVPMQQQPVPIQQQQQQQPVLIQQQMMPQGINFDSVLQQMQQQPQIVQQQPQIMQQQQPQIMYQVAPSPGAAPMWQQ